MRRNDFGIKNVFDYGLWRRLDGWELARCRRKHKVRLLDEDLQDSQEVGIPSRDRGVRDGRSLLVRHLVESIHTLDHLLGLDLPSQGESGLLESMVGERIVRLHRVALLDEEPLCRMGRYEIRLIPWSHLRNSIRHISSLYHGNRNNSIPQVREHTQPRLSKQSMHQGIQASMVRYTLLARMARRVSNFLILVGIPRGVVMEDRVMVAGAGSM